MDHSVDIAVQYERKLGRRIGTVARAEGMSSIAQAAGLNRESLYRALDVGGNPALNTIVKVLDVLGVQLAATPKPTKELISA